MTDWISAGAAGTSGTVTEPYAMQQKFPMPFIHVHYAKGCSLAEAFYQSLMGPYQLLVLGDPLKVRVEVKTRSKSKAVVREYPLPFKLEEE